MFTEICKLKEVEPFVIEFLGETSAIVDPDRRGHLKMALTNAGFPVEDLAGYTVGDPLPIHLRETTLSGKKFELRDYQKEAAQVFYASGSEKGGSGVIVRGGLTNSAKKIICSPSAETTHTAT